MAKPNQAKPSHPYTYAHLELLPSLLDRGDGLLDEDGARGVGHDGVARVGEVGELRQHGQKDVDVSALHLLGFVTCVC